MNLALRLLLYPLSWAYRLVSNLRNALYDRRVLSSYRSSLPVIGVGNISAGGNGKTPLCIFLVQNLKQRGYRPVVLMRGYGGSLAGPLLVQAEHHPNQVGDEAVLMHRLYEVNVVVASDRVSGCKFIEQRKLGDLIVLDDGFQHRRLERNVDIVSINVGTEQAVLELIDAELLPLGKYREERDPALRRADIVVLAYRRPFPIQPEVDRRIIRILPANIRACRSFVKSKGVWSVTGGLELKPCAVGAFCALGNPENFFESLRDLGFQLIGTQSFPDHHKFFPQDIAELRRNFPNLPLICSEKDSVKLLDCDLNAIFVLKIELEVIPTDAFLVQVERGLKSPVRGQADICPQ